MSVQGVQGVQGFLRYFVGGFFVLKNCLYIIGDKKPCDYAQGFCKLYVVRFAMCAGFDCQPCTHYAHPAQLYKRIGIFVRAVTAFIIAIGVAIITDRLGGYYSRFESRHQGAE